MYAKINRCEFDNSIDNFGFIPKFRRDLKAEKDFEMQEVS